MAALDHPPGLCALVPFRPGTIMVTGCAPLGVVPPCRFSKYAAVYEKGDTNLKRGALKTTELCLAWTNPLRSKMCRLISGMDLTLAKAGYYTPMYFLRCSPNCFVDRAEISISYGQLFAQLLLDFFWPGQIRSQSYKVIRGRYSLRTIFQGNGVFSHKTYCHWQEWRYYSWFRPADDHIWPFDIASWPFKGHPWSLT